MSIFKVSNRLAFEINLIKKANNEKPICSILMPNQF